MADRDVAVVAALASRTGEIDVVLSGVAELPSPWSGTTTTWSLPGSISIEELAGAGGGVGAPNVALVHLGVDALERDVFVDLEAIGLLAVDAPAESADLVVRSLASTVASSVFAEVAHLHAVGFDPETFLGHRLGSSRDTLDQALVDAAAHAAPIIACGRSTTALRARATGGEMWEPVIVFALTATSAPVESIPPSRGQAVVVCGAQESAGATLSPNGSSWVLRGPALGHEEIELDPLGLEEDQAVALFELVESASAPLTVDPDPVDTTPVVSSTDPPPVLVRLLGPVQVESATGEPVHFERSKALELVAWLATHRGRATRTAARTALWELDVRDATFANVVSDARRTLARVVPPPDDEEWVGRTMTEELPLHPLVATDAELVEAACARALGRPHDEAIAELERAIELVRGAPFEGTSYLWPDAEGITSNLVLLATSTAVELARHHLEQGDVAGVFRATTAGLLVLPGHEELIALRMRAHARVGDHAGVRQEWESYERVLVGDPWSDGEPAPKLVSLRRELLTPSPAST